MKRPLCMVCLCVILMAAIGVLIGKSPASREAALLQDISGEVLLQGRVTAKDSDQLILSSIVIDIPAASRQQTFPIKLNTKLIIQYEAIEGERIPLMGQEITLTGTFREFSGATNPGEADLAGYYHSLKISGRLKNVRILEMSESNWRLAEWLYRRKMSFLERLYRVFPDREASVMAAILVGERQGLNRDVKALYQRNGIIHILSISGLHISMIGMGLYRLLKRMGLPVWAAVPVSLLFLGIYGIMTGMPVSVCRALGMYALRMLAIPLKRTYDLPTATAIVACSMILWNPSYLTNAGFLLSFGAVLGAGVVCPMWKPDRKGEAAGVRFMQDGITGKLLEMAERTGQFLAASFSVSLAVTMTTLPLLLIFYYEIPIYAVCLNVLVIPLLGILVVTGFLVGVLPGTGILGTIDSGILWLYEMLCKGCEKLPCNLWNPGCPPAWKVILYYGILAAGLSWYGWRRKENTRGIRKKEKTGSHRTGILVRKWYPVGILTVLVIIIGFPVPHGTELIFLDVGQGDGIVLITPDDRVYLFDFGSTSREKVGEYVLKPFLKYKGIDRVNAVILSHEDRDHLSGIQELLQKGQEWGITVDAVLLPNVQNEDFEAIKRILSDPVNGKEGYFIPDTQYCYFNTGDCWEDDGVSFLCLHPDRGEVTESANAASACFLVETQGVRILLTGDVEKSGEKRLKENLETLEAWMEEKGEMGERSRRGIDFLKVSHHGSRNSTNEALLRLIRPSCAVISCGRNNSYGHPHEELLGRLEDAGCNVFRTDRDGAVTVRIRKGSYEVEWFGVP